MNPEIKTKWVAALRSGEYRQGRNVLKQRHGDKDTPQYCCLGVLCEIAIAEGVKVEVGSVEGNAHGTEVITYDGAYELPPDSVWLWAGMSDNNPSVDYSTEDDEEVSNVVAELNDDGYSFEQIAEWIEKSL